MAQKVRIIILVCIGILVWSGWGVWRNGRSPSTSSPYHLLYLASSDSGANQLFRASFHPQTQVVETKPLTQAAAVLLNFAPSPTGQQIAYSAQEDEVTTAVWLISADGRHPQKLLTCHLATCDQLVWHPDGRRLVYERRELDALGAPHLYWLDTKTAATLTVLTDETEVGSGAVFSPDGEWISYVSPPTEGVEVYNFVDGRRLNFSAVSGLPASWNSHSQSVLLIPDYKVVILHGSDDANHQEHSHQAIQSVHLFLTNLETGEQTSLSGDTPADDASASWSPNGEWILFGRKLPRTTMGRQLWLVRPDGTEAHALTDEPKIHHGVPVWSPDGRYILYQRFPTTVPDGTAGIWLLDMVSGQHIEIATPGTQPAWLP